MQLIVIVPYTDKFYLHALFFSGPLYKNRPTGDEVGGL